ncbi:MAG: hypothetical protein RRC07_07385 [Anaerolineae bacterium]|nr:hypothetical protein [Anaerolineae bacterium]
MKRGYRRIVYAVLLLLWLVVMLFPVFAVVLATRQQIELGSDPQRQVRIFLVQESAARGVGVEWTRPARGRADCTQSQLVYLMWRGVGENASFCTCYDDDGSMLSSNPGACPAHPPD